MRFVRSIVRPALVAAAVALTGCAATVDKGAGGGLQPAARAGTAALLIQGTPAVQASADWHTFRAEWRTAFSAAAGAKGLKSEYLESPAPQAPGTVLVKVFVNDYRYLTPGARYGLGVMTGNAFIDAEAEFVEYPGERSLGKRKFATSSSAWQGIFSAMTDKQVRAISDEMIAEIAPK